MILTIVPQPGKERPTACGTEGKPTSGTWKCEIAVRDVNTKRKPNYSASVNCNNSSYQTCAVNVTLYRVRDSLKLKFHGTPRPTRTSSPTCPRTFVRRALFLERMSFGDARVYTCTCTVLDKLSCTRLQNYTIGASLKSLSVSVSVSVPWNLSLTVEA